MARENIRPSESQIHNHYECSACGDELEIESYFAAPVYCHCGGLYRFSGESYPASSDEWAEERDDEYSEWHRRYWPMPLLDLTTTYLARHPRITCAALCTLLASPKIWSLM